VIDGEQVRRVEGSRFLGSGLTLSLSGGATLTRWREDAAAPGGAR
jgi:hypothetical protein